MCSTPLSVYCFLLLIHHFLQSEAGRLSFAHKDNCPWQCRTLVLGGAGQPSFKAKGQSVASQYEFL